MASFDSAYERAQAGDLLLEHDSKMFRRSDSALMIVYAFPSGLFFLHYLSDSLIGPFFFWLMLDVLRDAYPHRSPDLLILWYSFTLR